MNGISLESAIIVTRISKRTLWRRVTDGQIRRLDNNEQGFTMLAFDDVAQLVCVPVTPEDFELFVDADAGDADAQNDLAQLFIEAERCDVALHWLQQAAEQQHPDAMHNLGQLYIRGGGGSEKSSCRPDVADQSRRARARYRQATTGRADAQCGTEALAEPA